MFKFFPKKYDFLEMLSQQAVKTEEGVAALLDFLNNPTKQNGEKVYALEEEADEIRRVLVDSLNRTFVTPIDREDIAALSAAIDDVIDYAKSTVEEMILFEIKPDENTKEMTAVLHEATKHITYGVRHMVSSPGTCVEHIIRAKKAENKIERLYRKGLVKLFKSNDVIKILKTREIYRHLSNAADRVVSAALIIGNILVKHA